MSLLFFRRKLMKRFLSVFVTICILISSISLFGCNSADEPVDIEKDGSSTAEKTEKPTAADATEASTDGNGQGGTDGEATEATDGVGESESDEKEEIKYWEIACYTTKAYTDRHFSVEGANADVMLSVSSEWSFEESERGYDIIRGGDVIGSLISGEAEDADEWKKESGFTRKISERLSVGRTIESRGEGSDTEFRYRFAYTFTDAEGANLLTLTARYDEVDANAADVLYNSAELFGRSAVPDGAFESAQEGRILILGNSFIASSNIGSFLQDLVAINEKMLSVQAISRGYATVETYVSDDTIMSNLEEGHYDVVFICGFYSNVEVDYLDIMRSVCKASRTALVIFPAHNEQRGVIDKAQMEYPELYTLDWKAEIDALIDSGIDKWNFCINDEHQHSTELAGIVGALMIYKAIFGEMPNSYGGIWWLYEYGAEEILGSYLTDGEIEKNYDILYVG